jgi:hypothetical protein
VVSEVVTKADIRTVTLTPEEIQVASHVGIRRLLVAKQKKRRPGNPGHQHTGSEWKWVEDIEGAIGELAVAKYLGLYFPGFRDGLDTVEGDVAGIDVKALCEFRGFACRLIVSVPKGKADQVYLLTQRRNFTAYLCGWALEGDLVEDSTLKRPALAAWVRDLRPMRELRAEAGAYADQTRE